MMAERLLPVFLALPLHFGGFDQFGEFGGTLANRLPPVVEGVVQSLSSSIPNFSKKELIVKSILHYSSFLLLFVLLASLPLLADDPTPQYVALSPIPCTLPPSSSSLVVQFEVWDSATGGLQVSSETHNVDINGSLTITNNTGFSDLLLGRPGGLSAGNFPAGSSRYLDVTWGGLSVLTARIPLVSPETHTFTTIDFPGAVDTRASGINPRGDIVGGYRRADSVVHGFLLSGGSFTTIDFPGASLTETTVFKYRVKP